LDEEALIAILAPLDGRLARLATGDLALKLAIAGGQLARVKLHCLGLGLQYAERTPVSAMKSLDRDKHLREEAAGPLDQTAAGAGDIRG
jgi:hypothetical protein